MIALRFLDIVRATRIKFTNCLRPNTHPKVGLSVLCSFIAGIPPSAVPGSALSALSEALQALGPLRLFAECIQPQRRHAEKEVDLLALNPDTSGSTSQMDLNGPLRPLQVL